MGTYSAKTRIYGIWHLHSLVWGTEKMDFVSETWYTAECIRSGPPIWIVSRMRRSEQVESMIARFRMMRHAECRWPGLKVDGIPFSVLYTSPPERLRRDSRRSKAWHNKALPGFGCFCFYLCILPSTRYQDGACPVSNYSRWASFLARYWVIWGSVEVNMLWSWL